MSDYILVMCAAGNKKNAEEIASALVEKNLVACAQITSIESYYRWEGAVHHEPECLLMIKSIKANFEKIEVLIKEIHEYKLPGISLISIDGGSKEYLNWIAESSKAL